MSMIGINATMLRPSRIPARRDADKIKNDLLGANARSSAINFNLESKQLSQF